MSMPRFPPNREATSIGEKSWEHGLRPFANLARRQKRHAVKRVTHSAPLQHLAQRTASENRTSPPHRSPTAALSDSSHVKFKLALSIRYIRLDDTTLQRPQTDLVAEFDAVGTLGAPQMARWLTDQDTQPDHLVASNDVTTMRLTKRGAQWQ
jgi:hypothetical protein